MWARLMVRVLLYGRAVFDRLLGRAFTRWRWKLLAVPAIAVIGAVVAIGASTVAGSPGIGGGTVATNVLGDRFMEGIAQHNAQAIMESACPDLVSGINPAELERQMGAQHEAAERLGTTQSWDFVGARNRTDGGEVRFYLLTASSPTQPDKQTSYVVWTASGGCVERVE